MPTITRRELTIAIAWSLLVMLATSWPYLEGSRRAGDRYFCGLISAVDDGNAYLQWIRQTADGAVTNHNQYTTVEHEGLSFNAFLFGLGRMARALRLTPPQAFQIGRIAAGSFCLVAFFILACTLSQDRAFRWVSLVLVSVSAGFGWLFHTLLGPGSPIQPVDYGPGWGYQPEAITFASLLINPLFVFSMGLICLSLASALRAVDTGKARWAVAAGGCLLVLANVHTYDIIGVHLTIVAWYVMAIATKRCPVARALGHYAIMLALTLPAVAYQWHVMQADAIYRAKAATPTLSGPVLNYVTGYGVPWLLAVGAIIWLWRTKSPERARLAHLIPWFVAASVVIYLPVAWQRKAVEGLHFPICLLAAVPLVQGVGGWLERRAADGRSTEGRIAFIALAVALVSMPSNVLFFADCLHHVRTNNAELAGVLMPPLYLESGERDVLRTLAESGSRADVVMCSSMLGSHVPALTPCRVVAGHWAETIHLQPGVPRERAAALAFHEYALPAVTMFFSGRADAAARERVLRLFDATYVIAGPTEDRIYFGSLPPGSEFVPGMAAEALAGLPYLRAVRSAGGVTLFEVLDEDDLADSSSAS